MNLVVMKPKISSTEKSYVVDSIYPSKVYCEEIHRVRDVPALAYCNVSGACSKETVIDFQILQAGKNDVSWSVILVCLLSVVITRVSLLPQTKIVVASAQ